MQSHVPHHAPLRRRERRVFSLFLKSGFRTFSVAFLVGIIVLGGGVRLLQSLRLYFERSIDSRTLTFTTPPSEFGTAPGVIQTYPRSTATSGSLAPLLAGLIGASFSDLFSGTGWLDERLTTMFYDVNVTAFVLPPRFDWRQLDDATAVAAAERFAAASGANGCIATRCLRAEGGALFLDGREVSAPAVAGAGPIRQVFATALNTAWAVGVVRVGEQKSRGFVYRFDGREFTLVQGGDHEPLILEYDGVFGFGGVADDWLIVWGSYRSQAFRIRTGQPPEDVSRFFDVRVSGGGFAPRIIRVPLENSSRTATWYVTSDTDGSAKLVKLFQNGTDRIQGAVDLSPGLFGQDVFGAQFIRGSGATTLLARILHRDSTATWWSFQDRGFDKDRERRIVSSNVSTAASNVLLASIYRAERGDGGGAVRFEFSGDGTRWVSAAVGSAVELPRPYGRQVFWRGMVMPDSDPMTTPFLDLIGISYFRER